jgi:glycosyltransferase involved in cell wall biosynthesis
MTLAVCIPVLNQPEVTQATLDSLKARQKDKNIKYIIVDNGSTPPVRDWLIGLTGEDVVIRNQKNVGLPKALNQALRVNDADYLFCTHTDVVMYEQDWDEIVLKAIEEAGNVGVAGFFGAKGIGTPDIYHTPYMMQQLVRTNPISGNRCKLNLATHGQMTFDHLWEKCAVLDGFSLIVHKDLKFWTNSVHHCYDNQVCLEAINSGKQNIVINMDVDHLGGRTDVGEDWASAFGKTKQQVHAEAHIPFYEYWKPGKQNIKLPFSV